MCIHWVVSERVIPFCCVIQLQIHQQTHDDSRTLYKCTWEGCDRVYTTVSL